MRLLEPGTSVPCASRTVAAQKRGPVVNETNVKPEQKAPLIVGKETIKRLKAKSSLKAGWTQTSVCSLCTP